MYFEKKILDCENIDVDKNYIYKEGTKKVILTSVHSMIQHKEDGIKKENHLQKE